MLIGRGNEMLQARQNIQGSIRTIVRALKSKDSPLDKTSKKIAMVKLRDLRHKEKRLMKTASQKLAKIVADKAKRHGAGVWQMEELVLEEIKDNNPWLARNWAPGMIVDAIRWQATQCGAKLKKIDPRYTSQRCSKCGLISPHNRPKKKKKASFFECTACGYKNHADKNAAINISHPNIENIISEHIEQFMAPNGADKHEDVLEKV